MKRDAARSLPSVMIAQKRKSNWENKIICPKATAGVNQEASPDRQSEQTDKS